MNTLRSKKMKIVIASVVAMILLSGSALAAWVYFLSDGGITGSVTSQSSENVLVWSTQTADFGTVDATNNSVEVNQTISFDNNNGFIDDITVYLSSESVDANVSDGCDITGDLTSNVIELDGAAIANGSIINLTAGSHDIVVTNQYLQGSCPANYELNISLSQ